MIRLFHSLRKHLHNPPVKFPCSPFRLSNICSDSPTSINSCFPMAVNQNFPPHPLKALKANRNIPPTDDIDDGTSHQSSGKVKLLCSFGGKFITRPGDGALGYAGGHTRIITFPRDTTFHQLYCKLEDTYGGPVVIRYQLPDQSLDTLVSVSSVQDLDNMMEEYDCLVDASGCVPAKLRVFLFPPSDNENTLAELNEAASDGSRLTYIKAVNGDTASETDACKKYWKDCMENAASMLNSGVRNVEFADETPEHHSFPIHSTIVATTNVATQTDNLPFVRSDASFVMAEAPQLVSCSNHTPGQAKNFHDTSTLESFCSNQDSWKALGFVSMHSSKHTTLTNKEFLLPEDIFVENFLQNSSKVNKLLKEDALQCTTRSLNKNSSFDQFKITQGAYDVNQDLHDLVERVAESVLQSSEMLEPSPFSFRANEFNQAFNDKIVINMDDFSSHNVDIFGDKKIQIIKNRDLEDLQKLGSGTFATVYYGKWRGSDVAIKRFNSSCFAGKPFEQEQMMIDFWNEASILASLRHPNIVTFYGIVQDGPGGSLAIVTEYMVDGSLRNALLRNNKAFDQSKRLLIAMNVAFGMQYLHEKSVVHFDLKSDNVLVNLTNHRRLICKVGDLGLSKVKSKTLISSGVRGTLPWMAPELLNDNNNLVSEKVDVFSFGIVMWELLTGEEPYADLYSEAIISGIMNNTLRPSIPKSCDPKWRALMEQCWSTEPFERPSFIEIATRLRSMEASLSQMNQVSSA